MEPGTDNQSSTPKENYQKESSYLTPVLMLLGIILTTLSVIVAGYVHGNMHLFTTLKNAANIQ